MESLQIPAEFSRYDRITESQVISRLTEWKLTVLKCLSDVRDLVKSDQHLDKFTIQEQADIISSTAAFDGEGAWVSDDARQLAKDILMFFSDPKLGIIEHILQHTIKPIFISNPHPSLNLSTGRKLPRIAGGPMATQDYYEAQTWKAHPGAPNIILWCVRNTKSDAYEQLWHLIIPPVMTLLDDYEAPYKLSGIHIVSEMLERVPKDLLRRTGIDGLLSQSLAISLTHLQSPETPDLLRAAVPAILSLIELTTSLGSAQRFDQLCRLLDDGIIGGVWMYVPDDLGSMLASVDVLPPIFSALGIGSARYLTALIPQLLHPLLPNPHKRPPIELQLSSIQALLVIIDVCAVRMSRWKGTILEGIAKCWVTIIDSGMDNESCIEVQKGLTEVCRRLAKACPSVIKEEYSRLLAVDRHMFQNLVGPADVTLTV